MGWPKNDVVAKLYREKADGSYILVVIEDGPNNDGKWPCYANAQANENPNLCSTSCDQGYLDKKCKRVQWNDLPERWQKAFQRCMKGWHVGPDEVPGFWTVETIRARAVQS